MRVEVGEVGGLLGVAAEVVQGHLGSVRCLYSEVEESVHLGACLRVPRPVCVQAGGEAWLVGARAAHQAAGVGPVVPAADMASVQPEPEQVLQEQVVLLPCRRYPGDTVMDRGVS